MRGLKHNVIEINDTENENIEKILVFLKPHTPEIALAATRAQATQLLSQLEVRSTKKHRPRPIALAALGAALALAAILLLILL